MEYPTRKATQGFQPSMPPPAANDNRPSLPVIPFPLKHAAGRKAAQSLAGLAAKALLRLNPWVRIAWTLYDVYDMYRQTQGPYNQPSYFDVPSGWVLDRDCGLSGDVALNHTYVCGTNYNIPPALFADYQTFPRYAGGRYWYSRYQYIGFFFGNHRLKLAQSYTYPVAPEPLIPPPHPAVIPAVVQPGKFIPAPRPPRGVPASPWTQPAPLPTPALDPFALPVQQPVEVPRPIPYRLIPYRVPNPYRSPLEQPSRGPGPQDELKPRQLPQEEATKVLEPGKPPVVGAPPELRRPGPGVKERKIRATRAAGKIVAAVNQVTEAKDVVEAFYEALPDKFKPHVGKQVKVQVSFTEKARLVYRHFQDIPAYDALKALADNQAEDRFFGAIGQDLKQGAQSAHEQGYKLHGDLPFGFQRGPVL